jgi:hypothetical protein
MVINMAAGRKSKYQELVQPRLDEVREWRLMGKTEIDIAKLLGIGYATLKEYKNKFTDFSATLKESTQLLIEDLEKSLFEVAKGGIRTKTTKRIFVNKNGELILDKVEETENISLPNIAALTFSLKNLSPTKWVDRREYTTTGADHDNNRESLLDKLRVTLADSEEEVIPDVHTV